MDCVFCKIVNNEIPSYKIYEDDLVLAFLNIKPDSPGHTLIIPKKHYKDIVTIDNNTLIHIIDVIRSIKEKLEKVLEIDGLTLVQNNGDIQEIKHFHFHLKPFYKEKRELEIEKVFDLLK